ncbi:replicase polyprotein 1A [Colletotrichum tofieldiae]|nr:replicase polyprotein 1A [Colletotrichum tofieldiae]
MFGLLPDLTPRDSHSIWYTSSRNPVTQAALLGAHDQRDNNHGGPSQQQQQHNSSSRRAGQLLIERSALARLRADEQQMDRRRLHVQNFGSTWLKPPGVPKSLHQIREERREQEEHAEAMRREQLAQELAEAEAAGQDGLEDVAEGEEAGEVRDLDDEIPDAEESFGFDGGEDSMADELSSSEEELEASGQGHMLDEEDLLAPGEGGGAGDDLGMDMDADLDDEIPEAGELSGVYEHTDSEAELSLSSSSDARGASSDEDDDEDDDEGDISFAPRAAPLRAPLSPTGDRGRGLRGPAGPRSSMDLSGLLSADGSSMMDSSPNVRAQRR